MASPICAEPDGRIDLLLTSSAPAVQQGVSPSSEDDRLVTTARERCSRAGAGVAAAVARRGRGGGGGAECGSQPGGHGLVRWGAAGGWEESCGRCVKSLLPSDMVWTPAVVV